MRPRLHDLYAVVHRGLGRILGVELVDPQLMARHIPHVDDLLLRVLRDPWWSLEKILLLLLGPHIGRSEQASDEHQRDDQQDVITARQAPGFPPYIPKGGVGFCSPPLLSRLH